MAKESDVKLTRFEREIMESLWSLGSASVRLAELYRLARFRRVSGLAVEPNAFAFALAATLACGAPGPIVSRSSKGPAGYPQPSFIALSMSSAVA